MDIKESETYKQANDLFDRGLYRQALDFVQSQWGSHRDWTQSEQLLLAGKLFSNLGITRKAIACRLKAWRSDKNNPDTIYYHVASVFMRKGPLQGLRLLKKYGDLTNGSTERRAQWFGLCANIYGQYRDWETADHYIKRAKELAPQHPWVKMEQAYLLEAQDSYESAWREIKDLVTTGYRPALQFGAHLKSIENNNDAAIELLESRLMSLESISVCLQLFRLAQTENRWELAEKCIERAKSLIPEAKDYFTEQFAVAEYELAFQKNDIEQAAESLAQCKSEFYLKIRENLKQANPEDRQVLLDVPFVRQHHMTCAPATLSAIFKFWGQEAQQLDIVEEICYDGTHNHAERQWVAQQGWALREFELNEQTVFELIDRGVALTLSTVGPGAAHLQAVVGYDKRKRVYLLRDPYYPTIQELLIDDPDDHCLSNGPRCLVFVPKEKEQLFEGIDFPAQAQYDANFDLMSALEKHDRSRAVEILEKSQESHRDHRLTLVMTRALARYDNNKPKELQMVESLLKSYPGDLNLQVEKAVLLDNLGRTQEQIEFLKQQASSPDAHPYIVETLANYLRRDEREAGHTAKLLNYVLTRQPTNAAALYGLAGSLWSQENYEQSFEYYRLCSTLEDKREGYIESYFKAARYLDKTEQAIENLKKRVATLGKRSFYPHESLYYAYKTLSLDQQGLEVLIDAVAQHPESGEAIGCLATSYIFNGLPEKAEALINERGQFLSQVKKLELSAEIARYSNDWQEEKLLNDQILEQTPLNYNIIDSQAALLGRHKGDGAAIEFLDARIALNKYDSRLLFMKLDWLYNEPLGEQEQFAKNITSIHPGDCSAYQRLADIQTRLGKLDEAEQFALKAYEINPFNTKVLTTVGDVYYKKDSLEKAKQYYRETVEYWVDTDGIFQRLLNCCSSAGQRTTELDYISRQLMEQTTYGDGILEYLEVAGKYVSNEEMLTFLEQAVATREDLWHCWAALSIHLREMNELERAVKVAGQAIEKFPLLPRLWVERGAIHHVAQHFDLAEQDMKEAVRLNPQWTRALTSLVDALEAQVKYDEVFEVLATALKHAPNNSVLHGYMADFQIVKNEPELALKHIEKSLEIDSHYEWAWGKYGELSSKLKLQDAQLTLAKRLLEKEPENIVLWKKLAEFESEPGKKIEYINRALEISPKNEDLHLEKCRALFESHELSQIKEIVHAPDWGDNPPAVLLGYEAWIEAQFQRYDTAITMMKKVVEQHPYYYDGWRLLSRWAQQSGKYQQSVEYIDHCVRLYPHSTDALTLAAEAYMEAGENKVEVDKKRISSFLEKAVILNPRDQYSALTWLDYLIDCDDRKTYEYALGVIQYADENPYFLVRFMKMAAQSNDNNQVYRFLSLLIETKETNEWLFLSSYQIALSLAASQQLWAFLESVLAKPDTNPLVGQLWIKINRDLEDKKHSLVSALECLEANSPMWMQAMEAIFDSDSATEETLEVIAKYRSQLQENGRLWSLVTYYLANVQKWEELRSWCKNNWKRESNDAFAVYLYNYGLRLDEKWERAAAVNAFAATQAQDDYIDRIILWKLVDDLDAHSQPIDTDLLSRIRYPELSEFEQYAYSLIAAVKIAQDAGGIVKAWSPVSAALHQAKVNHPDLLAYPVVQMLKLKIRRYLMQQIQGGWWEKITGRFRLFNLM